MKNTIKIARLNSDGTPVYDCTVFAVDGDCIEKDVNITGDFIGGDDVSVYGGIKADGIVCSEIDNSGRL